MTTFIASILLRSRKRSRIQSIAHLDDRLLADIGLTRADFRNRPAMEKTA